MDFKIRDYLYPFQIIFLKRYLSKSKNFTYENIIEYQNKKLEEIIKYAYYFIPYYKELFDKNRIKPEKIKTINDLSNIPILTKEIVRNKIDQLICDNKYFQKNRPQIYYTSGTTGTPLKLYHDKYTNISKLAFYWHMWEIAGYKIGKKMAVISGAFADTNRLFNYKKLANTLYISIFKINKENSLEILDELIKFKCEILRGVPSAVHNFLRFIENNKNINRLNIKSVICVSENLLDFQRNYIKSILKADVFNMYCQWEHVCLAIECESGNMHHQMENGVLEILDNDNNSLGYNRLGIITATGFYNRTMPLIRYKTGDLAVKKRSDCKCNRNHDIIEKLDGRAEEVIFTPDGRFVSGLNSAFKYIKGFDFAQIIQNKKDSIDVKIVKNNWFSENELKIFEQNLRLRLGNEIKINFYFVSDIERSKSGKAMLVINNFLKNKSES